MAEPSLSQLALEASSRSLDPDRLATDLFLLSVRIFMEIDAVKEQIFDDPTFKTFTELRDGYIKWGDSLDARNGVLDKIPVDEDLRDLLHLWSCLAPKGVKNLACQTSLKETLVDVFQKIDELESYAHSISNIADSYPGFRQPNDVSPAAAVDDSSSSGSEGSISEEVLKEWALEDALEEIERCNRSLHSLGMMLYDKAMEADPSLLSNALVDPYL